MRIGYMVEMRLEITLSMRIAFIKGRSIYDNTIVAHEVYISYHEVQIKGRGLMDMKKAFDYHQGW
jgi:hypothetical protein